MTTALDIIKRSMRMLGVYSIGETPPADETADCLRALNSMLESWANENLLIYAKTLDLVPISANKQSYIIGPSGADLVTTRPVEVSASSYLDYQGVSYGLTVATLTDFNQIPVKQGVSGIPCEMYALMNMPNITVSLWPVPSLAMTMNLWSNKQLQSFASVTDVAIFPPGYDRMLSFCLAEELGPEFDVQPSAFVQLKAKQARKVIKRTNTEVPRLNMPYGVPSGRGFINYRNA